jgi:predicted GNAT family acetyltransferase
MQLTRYDDPDRFRVRAVPFLAAHEAEHNLPLGILAGLREHADDYTGPPYLALVEEGDAVVAAAIMTPPYNLILSRISDEARPAALDLLARDLLAARGDLPGVLGLTADSTAFAEIWVGLAGVAYDVAMRERIYMLETVRPVHGVPGGARRAGAADRELLTRWMAAFQREALPSEPPLDAARWAEHALAAAGRTILLWEDGEPVSLACAGSTTPHGIRVGPVYTPPERRGRGYASACVAALSQLELDAGHRFCFLFTDLANPTSNHIYQEVGYTPVGDVAMYRFERTAS